MKEKKQKANIKHINVQDWRAANPSGSKLQCSKELKYSQATVAKFWNVKLTEEERKGRALTREEITKNLERIKRENREFFGIEY